MPSLRTEAAGELLADLQHRAGRRVAGAERELPVRQVRVFQPLVRAGVDGEFRPGADGGVVRREQNLIRRGVGQLHFADFDFVRFDDDGLACENHAGLGGKGSGWQAF
jgi:hypothetical protein